nr:STAS domain-containing protein [Oceanobacter mangrovi]
MSIECVEALHQEMEQAVRDAQDIFLKADDVQYCDTAGLQLLLALVQTVQAAGLQISWQGVSDVVRDTSKLLGLTSALLLATD